MCCTAKKTGEMRATRNASKGTPPVRRGNKWAPAKFTEPQKQEDPKIVPTPVTTEVKAVTQDVIQEESVVNGDSQKREAVVKSTTPVKKRVSTSLQKAEVKSGRQDPVVESAEVQQEVFHAEVSVTSSVVDKQIESSVVDKQTERSVGDKQTELEEEAPIEMEVEEQEEEEVVEEEEEEVEEEVEEVEEEVEEVEEEVEEVEEEVEEEEYVDDMENEEEQTVVGEEEAYNEDEEIEEVEEVEVEEVEEVEEEVEEEEEEHVTEGEDVLEERPVTERQKRKKFEVFVGGLDKDATEDDLRKAFEEVGEVVEVRLMKHPQTGKNKGYAFVRFATVDQAKRAATELERTKIRGKECGVVPSEDNDTLFVGNISKSWKKGQVLEKLKEYGVEGVEEVTLMADSRNEELNRGYAFVELATHNDAVKAYVRLSRPDAFFGFERSAKVAWAEPLIDDEVLAKVKSVFVDGVPSSWDEPKLKEHFEKFGQIERIVLAKNNPKTKRNDYAFVNYAAREAAVACVEAFKNGELIDGDTKIKVKVALSKPVPRKKHVKGSRGGHPVGGYLSGRGRGWVPIRGSFIARRGRGGRSLFRGGRAGWGDDRRPYDEPRFVRPPKKPVVDDRHYLDLRPRTRPPPRGAAPPRASRGVSRGHLPWRDEPVSVRRPSYEYSPARGRGGLSRRGRGGPYRDEYTPRGARISSGFTRGSSSRRGRGGHFREDYVPREDAFSRRPSRSHAYDRDLDVGYGSAAPPDYGEAGPGMKRSYAEVDEGATYYESNRRAYPRARVDYVDPAPAGGAHYAEPSRAPLGRSSVGGRHAVPPQPAVGGVPLPPASVPVYDQPGSSALYGSGGHGYSSMMPGGTDYSSGANELRGGTYNSSVYGGRTGSTYGLPGSASGSYY